MRTDLTPSGSTGPYADYRAYDLTVFHAGGEGYLLPNGLALDTFPDRTPIVAGGQMGSYQAGLTAAVGILAAVYARRTGVPGEAVDASGQEAQLAIGYIPIQRLESEGVVEDRFADELDRHLEAWTARLSPQEVTRRLQQEGVAAFPSLSADQLMRGPHLLAREAFPSVEHQEKGRQRAVGYASASHAGR